MNRASGSVSNAGTVYHTPSDEGSSMPVWSGSGWGSISCPEISNVLANSSVGNAGPTPAVPNAVYDLYVWLNNGVPTLSRSEFWYLAGTATNTNASPAVFTQAGTGALNGTPVRLAVVGGGSLSPNFTPGTTYYVIGANIGAGTFSLAATPGGTPINAGGACTAASQVTTIGLGNNNNLLNAVVRGTANGQTRTNSGLIVNTLAIPNGPAALFGLWVGTVCTNVTGGVDYIFGGIGAGGVAASFMVYNHFNGKPLSTSVIDTQSYSYAGAYRQAGSPTSNNTIDWLLGDRRGMSNSYTQKAVTAAVAGAECKFAMGFDILTVDVPPFIVHADSGVAHTGAGTVGMSHNDLPIGRHQIIAMEAGDGTNGGTFGNQDGSIGGILSFSMMN
jgi:hypothetical protein